MNRYPVESRRMRRRLPWLVVLPLMVAGSLAAHALSYVFVGARAEGAAGTEGGMSNVADRSSTSFASHSVLVLGLVAAIAVSLAAARLIALGRGRPGRGPPLP